MVLPEGIFSSGFPAVDATCRQLDLFFDPWQEELNRCILAKERSGLYAADTVVLSIPRQVGKTWDVGALVFADCIIHPGTTTVWTAHRFKVARETFNELKGVALTPALGPHINPDDIHTAAGNESIGFRNGSRIVFAARERGAIRGFTKVRRLILDEAQILSDNALADLAPTMNQAENPQIILMGTPPRPIDPSEVFARLRTEALSGESEGVLYVEFSAERGSRVDDKAAWRVANPSYPRRTSTKAIERLRRLLSPDDFLREAMGVWDDPTRVDVFGDGKWEACAVPELPEAKMAAIGLAVSFDLTHAAIVAVGFADGVAVVKPLQHGPGTRWLAERAKELQEQHKVPVVIDGHGPGADMVDDLEGAKVDLTVAVTANVLDACAGIYKRVQEGQLAHGSFRELDTAAAGAVRRDVGDRWAWGRKKSTADISPLEAATLAVWAAETVPEKKQSPYESRGLMTVG